jgi:ferredoxin
MANNKNKCKENMNDKYFIDTECIACGTCLDIAPNNIKFSADNDHAFVFKQPQNDQEKKSFDEAMEGCPTESIGMDK